MYCQWEAQPAGPLYNVCSHRSSVACGKEWFKEWCSNVPQRVSQQGRNEYT